MKTTFFFCCSPLIKSVSDTTHNMHIFVSGNSSGCDCCTDVAITPPPNAVGNDTVCFETYLPR